MHIPVILHLILLAHATASISWYNDISELIVDYVEYKNASRLLSAFLCLQDSDVASLTRKFTNASISATVLKPSIISKNREILKNVLNYHYHQINVVVDLECEDTEELMIEASANKMFNYSYAWLVLSNKESYALETMAKLNLSVDADVVVAIASGEETVLLYDVFNTGSDRNGTFNATFIGTWGMERRFDLVKLQSFVYRRQNLTGILLKFAAVAAYIEPEQRDAIKYLSNFENKTYDNISKFAYSLTDGPRDFFNYSMVVSTWIDYGGKWNGPYFGMMGAVGRRDADFTVGGTMVTRDRLDYAVPIVQHYPFWTGFLFKHPASHSIRNAFLEPLAPSAWVAVLVISIIVIFMVTLTTYYNMRDKENPWSFGIHLTLGTLFQQGWSTSPPGPSGHLLILVFVVFSMLLYNFYGASVVSSLLSDPPQTIRTIADLLDSGMPAAYEEAGYVVHYFTVSSVEAERNFYKKRLLEHGKPRVLSRAEGIQRVKAGGFAYHTTPADMYEKIAREFTQPEICCLTEVAFLKKSILTMWGSRENPYREHLRIIHRRMVEAGIQARELKRWLAQKPECLSGVTTLNSIALNNVAPAFLSLFCGAVASLFVLVIELAHHSVTKKRP